MVLYVAGMTNFRFEMALGIKNYIMDWIQKETIYFNHRAGYMLIIIKFCGIEKNKI